MQSLQSFFISTLSTSERLNVSDLQISLGLSKRQSAAMLTWIAETFTDTISEHISDNGIAKVIKIISINEVVTITILTDIVGSKILLNSSKLSKELSESFSSVEQFLSALKRLKDQYYEGSNS